MQIFAIYLLKLLFIPFFFFMQKVGQNSFLGQRDKHVFIWDKKCADVEIFV